MQSGITFAKKLGFLICCSIVSAVFTFSVQAQRHHDRPVHTGKPSQLVKAVESNNFAELQRLIAADVDLNEFHYDYQTALTAAAQYERGKFVKALIAAGADVNRKNSTGWTALIWAAQRGNAEIAQMLVDAGADVDARENTFGSSALLRAARDGNIKTVEVLIKAGANLYQKDKHGSTAFLLAAEGGKVETVKRFLDLGFDPNSYSDGGYTALGKAARHPEILKMLIAAGAKVDLQIEHFGVKSYTALYVAAQNGWADSVKVLIEAGADVNIPDFDGRTPLNRALVGKYAAVAELLKAAGAKESVKVGSNEQ